MESYPLSAHVPEMLNGSLVYEWYSNASKSNYAININARLVGLAQLAELCAR